MEIKLMQSDSDRKPLREIVYIQFEGGDSFMDQFCCFVLYPVFLTSVWGLDGRTERKEPNVFDMWKI